MCRKSTTSRIFYTFIVVWDHDFEHQDDTVEARLIGDCAIGSDGVVGEFDDDIEEGIPYITGNILWAVYQFITFIVLLSVLRARMVNTYHRIFREADVQWKFFR